MASRKNLKKVITFVSDQLATQAFFASYDSKADVEAWIEVFNKIYLMNKEFVSRVSHAEPGLPAKKYFDTLCLSFNEEAKVLLDEIQKLSENK